MTTAMAKTTLFNELFIDHPRSVGESYGEHRATAWFFGGRLFVASLAAFIHGLFPGLCKTTASGIVRELNRRLEENRRG
jgi:Family of unknown function (DUF6356)